MPQHLLVYLDAISAMDRCDEVQICVRIDREAWNDEVGFEVHWKERTLCVLFVNLMSFALPLIKQSIKYDV